jgi:hypothetical protein
MGTHSVSMRDLREVECLACKKIGMTCYAQCRNCGTHHEVEVIE